MSATGTAADPAAPVVDPNAAPVVVDPAAPVGGDGNLGSDPPAAGAGEGNVDPTPAPDPSPNPEPAAAALKQPAWKAEKYDKVFAQKQALQEELDRLKAAQDPNAPKLTEAEINQRAQALAAQAEFDRRANAVAEEGKKAYPDFLTKVGKIREQVDPNDQAEQARFVGMVAAVLETGEHAPRILYEIGSNPDLATEMMTLNPVQLGRRLAQLETKKPDPEPSRAPKPMSMQVGGRGASQEEIDPADPNRSDKLSTQTWMKRRQAEIEEKKKAGIRIW